MATQPWPEMRIDIGKHMRNNALVPPEYLVPFWGKKVAWHADGTHIVAAADTPAERDAELLRLGIDAGEVVFGYVDDPNLVEF